MASAVVTTSTGAPVSDNKNSLTTPGGLILLSDTALIDKLAAFDRQRIPERVVHAKGAGAHGYFEVTVRERQGAHASAPGSDSDLEHVYNLPQHDISAICKADLFSAVGKRTPVFARFSTVGGEKGSADSARDVSRGGGGRVVS